METMMNVAKVHHVEYKENGWFSGDEGASNFLNVLNALNLYYSSIDEKTEVDIERSDIEGGLKALREIEKGVDIAEVDTDELMEFLDDAGMTIAECIECFEWLLDNSDKKHGNDRIYVSFF